MSAISKTYNINEGGSHLTSPRIYFQVPFAACLEKWAAPELLEGVDGGPGGTKRTMIKQTRFATFPPYLLIQMRRHGLLTNTRNA